MRKNTKPHERGGSILSHLFFYTTEGRESQGKEVKRWRDGSIRHCIPPWIMYSTAATWETDSMIGSSFTDVKLLFFISFAPYKFDVVFP